MKISNLFRVVLTGIAVFSASHLWAQDGGQGRAGGRGGNGVEAILKQLDLSSEQQQQIAAIQKESNEAREAILAKHGIKMGNGERPDREAMSAARPDLNAARDAATAKISAVLTETQLAKFKELSGAQARGGERAQGERKQGAGKKKE